MVEPIRISPEETRDKVTSGSAILVCAYDDENKFNANRLEDAISQSDLRAKLSSLPRNKEIIFYCA